MLTEQVRAELYNKLFSRRREILERSHRLKDQWQDVNVAPGDLPDKAQQENAYQRLGQVDEQSRQEIHTIDRALQKMDSGAYGICESCGSQISPKRLQALPWAALCRECVKDLESREERIPAEETEDTDRSLMTYQDPEAPSEVGSMSDEELLEYVQELIHSDGRVETADLEILCQDGFLYLQGTLPNELQYNLLLGILQDVVPLENIEESLRIESLAHMGSDEEQMMDRTDETDDELLWGDEER